MKTVLFLCTGNYYRSRFAEILFNHLAANARNHWQAQSRGLALSPDNVGPISVHAVEELQRIGIHAAETRLPVRLTEDDLKQADRVVAVQDTEHRPMMLQTFPDWVPRTEFWDVADIEFREPADALTELARNVRQLWSELASQ